MTPAIRLLATITGLSLVSCSGLVPDFRPKGKIVTATHLSRYSGIGSISTLWYRGSDAKYHYFSHHVKVSTRYRVKRDELSIPDEFPIGSKDPVYIGMADYFKDLNPG